MGKIIVKNISGMGWKTRIGLIAMFTLVFTILIYQGRNQFRSANAAIAVQTNWAIIGTGTTSTFPAMSLAKGAGSNRLLVVKVVADYSTAITTFTPTVTYGGQTMTKIISTDTSSRQKVSFHYLNEAGIAAATGALPAFTVTWNSTPQTGCGLSAAFYSNVNQATPTTGSRAVSSDTAATGPTSGTISVTNGGWAIYGSNLNSNTVTTTTPASYTKHFDTANSTLYEDSVGSKQITATGTENPLPVWPSIRYAFAAIGLNPATTTLGNGTAGTTGSVAPGAADQKLDGFSFVTTGAGTTDSVTGLTVTTTNQAAIASMKIMNEAGSTQYFSTVNNPGSNTWVFSGGTPIPVASAVSNYKILVTYKTRAAGAPSGSTATTANVTAYTSGNVNAATTDTADTTLTLSNIHAASIWGTNTAGNAQVTLNWTYGTSGQSVIIIRYTSATDTTKPVDGTTYSTGSPFGSGGTVRYVGAASTATDTVGVANGTTYYYKIFEYDSYTNYYNASDVWTAGLTPISPDAVAPTVDNGFSATTPINVTTIPVISFGATDNVGGSGVSGYLITTSSTQPAAGAAGWTSTPPATFTVAGQGSYTLYPWAKDAGNNVSSLYGAPVTVVVDLASPTVNTFTVASQVATRNIPLSDFTGSDTGGSGMAAYMVTTSSSPPASNNPGWLGSAPATYTVGSDGSYTLYPWAKDAAGNVSAVFGSPRTVLVDTTAPTGLSLVSPADEAVAQPQATTLTCSTATDSGSGGVMYQFQISDGAGYSQNSGWIAGTSYAPPGLAMGGNYTWSVKAKDALGNETVWLTNRSFTVTAPCVRNDPTLILLTSGGGIASTISTDSGTAPYNLRLINNDTGDCGSTTFNLTINDTDLYNVFDNSTFNNGLTTKSISLQPGGDTLTAETVTVRATPGEDSGVAKTTVTAAADPNHASVTTGFVQTTLNVVTCQPKVPLLIVGPDSGYLNKGGKMVYTITIKNTDAGAGCSPVTYNLSLASESNSTDFDASQFSAPSLTLGAGELGSATLTVSAKTAAARNAINLTAVHVAATAHTSPSNVTITSTVNNPMLHNSDNTYSTKWSVSGGWGIPNGRYGEIECNTCHVGGGGDTTNIKRINEKIFTPYTATHNHFPGEGVPVAYRRYIGNSATMPVLGWDAGATPRTNPTTTKICESCHTYDASSTNGVKAHPFATTATLGNHFSTDGKDCTKCHKHNNGFGVTNMPCNSCHGDANATVISAANRFVVAPPTAVAGSAGTLTGTGQVSNDPKVGAHQTHLRFLNGFSNYSTVDFRCQGCHGTLPTNFTHADGSSSPVFQGLANNRGAKSSSFNSTNLTCSNTYCHNPAGTGGTLAAANAGLAIMPSWTSAKLISDTPFKSQTNCNRCHKVPGDAGFSYQSSHGAGMVTDQATDCSGCHGHNGDASGAVGKRHMDGIRYAAGNCDSCHDYDTVGATWGTVKPTNFGGFNEAVGAHAKHINYLKSRWSIASLDAVADGTIGFGQGNAAKICGACHTNVLGNHMAGNRMINFGDNTDLTKFGTNSQYLRMVYGTAALYNGDSTKNSATQAKTCSNLSCHYFITPNW